MIEGRRAAEARCPLVKRGCAGDDVVRGVAAMGKAVGEFNDGKGRI